jgi:hypothetical protein
MHRKLRLNFSHLKSKFQIISDGEMTKTKVVDLKKLYNFIVENELSHLNLFRVSNTHFKTR